jgi:ABC-type Fe3+/spermidine/putrescine transport system ATPase subunit
MDLLSISGISKQKDGNFILKDINFTQQPFQKIAIAGETGSGKTTLLKIIAGLLQPTTGQVLFKQKRVLGPEQKLIPGHAGIGYVSQHFELRNNYRVEEELSYTNRLTNKAAARIYEVCRISNLLRRWTHQLSGGEKQRIVTARVLIASPQLLLLDEPFSNLDMAHRNLMNTVINDIGEQLKITCMLVSHDPLDTLSWADEIIVLKDGEIVQRGTEQQIYHQPVNEYCAALFGKYNLITADQIKYFAGLQNSNLNKKHILIRPEHFNIVTKEKGAAEGRVNKVSFFGSYYEIEVLLAELKVTVKTGISTIAKADTIYISLRPGNAWYLDK